MSEAEVLQRTVVTCLRCVGKCLGANLLQNPKMKEFLKSANTDNVMPGNRAACFLTHGVMCTIDTCAELQILEAKTSELRLEKENGEYKDLTLRCVGESKSRPQWKHNGVIVNETLDTILNTAVNRTSRSKTLTMTRQSVTERYAGSYQCVDTAFFQSDSDILTVVAGARVNYPGRYHNT